MILRSFLTVFLATLPFFLSAWVDLEEFPQDFILETRQIEIPERPHAFNPSLVRWKGKLLMSFREISFVAPSFFSSSGESALSLVWLNDTFEPTSKPQKIDFSNNKKIYTEDGRLILIKDRLYLIYSGYKDTLIGITEQGFRLYVAELDFDGSEFHVIHNECLSDFEGKCKNRREKNWVPFVSDNHLHLAYQIKPHKILKPLLDGTGRCETVAFTKPSLVWDFGEIRGGTTALPCDEDHCLSFFHSSINLSSEQSKGEETLHYFIGAYTFSTKTPFTIDHISPEPIIGENFYKGEIYEPYWKPVTVAFPCGFIFEGEEIILSFGKQDHECWITRINKKKLLESLIPVMTYP